MTAPITPAAVPVPIPAAAPAAPAPTTTAPVGLPPTFGAGGPPKVVNASSGGASIPADHFNKPILFHILNVSVQPGKYEAEIEVPLVNYVVLDPATGDSTEHRGVAVMTGQIRRDLVNFFRAGNVAVTGVCVEQPTGKNFPAKVLRPLDDTNSGYGVELATQHLMDAAQNRFGWWSAA